MLNIIQPDRDFSTAREFLNALLPINWPSPTSGTWLFRGQTEDKPLVPSLFRHQAEKIKSLVKRPVDPASASDLTLAERDVLSRFFEIADKRGLVLPDDSQQLRSMMEIFKSLNGEQNIASGFDGWQPTERFLSLTALAQHYGIPTRLLDWSRLPLVAAFFAASGAAKRYRHNPSIGSERMVVWALLFPAFGKHDHIGRSTAPLVVVTAPSASNPNLQAQQGVFTWHRPEYGMRAPQIADIDWPLEEMLAHIDKESQPNISSSDALLVGCKLQKFTLVSSEADELLQLLARMDVTDSAVFPGYTSIIRDMEHESRWP